MQQSYTAVLERNTTWRGAFETEPYECAWASEALFFVRTLDATPANGEWTARVQISPDGMNWCDEGALISIPSEPGVSFCRVRHFGGWLRIAGELPDGAQAKVIVYLSLKE